MAYPSSLFPNPCFLDPAALRRTAAVVRHRRNVADAAHIDTRSSECADRGLAAGAGACNANVDCTQTVVASSVGGVDRCLLRRERRALTRAAEPKRTRALPRQRIALLVGDGDDRVVERRLDKHETEWNVLA